MQPQKWRETIDPFKLIFREFKILNIIGYPHAGNDVFFVNGLYKGLEIKAYLKVERQIGADIEREISTIPQIPSSKAPKILEYSLNHPRYILTEASDGERLSSIIGNNDNLESINYMNEYGKSLAYLHKIKGSFEPVKERKFFYIPDDDFFCNHDLFWVKKYLIENKPLEKSYCFVHGDFHYANILWKDSNICCILDYELSGIGIKEFDIAWALILRPGQKFLKTEIEKNIFISAYREISEVKDDIVDYFMVQIYCYFYEIGIRSNDIDYCEHIIRFMKNRIKK